MGLNSHILKTTNPEGYESGPRTTRPLALAKLHSQPMMVKCKHRLKCWHAKQQMNWVCNLRSMCVYVCVLDRTYNCQQLSSVLRGVSTMKDKRSDGYTRPQIPQDDINFTNYRFFYDSTRFQRHLGRCVPAMAETLIISLVFLDLFAKSCIATDTGG